MNELEEIMEIRNDAFYTVQAQKLDMIFKKLDQSPHTQLRWIWQLIQNAKDAPNKFGKVKIKQTLTDSHFISSHNGDAFNLKELHSIATQYSTKQQKNTQKVKTTGKYGTGFLTTHIISKKVTIQSILKYKKYQKKESDEEEQNQKKQKSQKMNTTQKIKPKPTKRNKKQDKNQQDRQNKQKSQYYYKKFDNLVLDRSFVDRDKQLPLKIKKAQRKLNQIAHQAKYSTIYNANKQLINYYQKKRKVDSYDTSFKYEIQDLTKFQIIQKAIQNIKQLIGFAFLFNPNLQYYQFIDQRKNDKNLSFSIKRVGMKNIIKKISVFQFQFAKSFDSQKKKFKQTQTKNILTRLYNDNPIVGIPIQIDDDDWMILKVDQRLSQVFKQFPLIGSPPIKWNAVINSDQFYPNEERSNLLLKSSDLETNQRVAMNKENLSHCFQGIKQLYLYLAQYDCRDGLQNLLILDPDNQYVIQNQNLKAEIQKHIDKILETNFIPVIKQKQKCKCKPKDLAFIQFLQAQILKNKRLQLSMNLNKIFSFLFTDKYIFEDCKYFDFYTVLNYYLRPARFKALNNDQYISYSKCLKELGNIKFSDFQQYFEDQQEAFKKLHQIYELKNKYKLDNQIYKKHKIYLNENMEFVAFQKGKMMKKTINVIQQQLLDLLDIQFRQNLIYPEFIHHFKEQIKENQFDQKKMESLIKSKFNRFPKYTQRQPNQNQINQLKLILQILITFNVIPQKTHKILFHLQIFNNVQQLKFSKPIEKQKIINDTCLKQLSQIFTNNLSYYFYHQINNKSLITFSSNTIKNIQYTQSAIYLKSLFNDQLVGKKLSQIPVKLSADYMIFVPNSKLLKLPESVSLPNQQDIDIYNILKNRNDPSINSYLVSNIYPYYALEPIDKITYKRLYASVLTNYQNLQQLNKQKVLNYVDRIYHIYQNLSKTKCVDKTISQKYAAFADLNKEKHKKMFKIRQFNPIFQKQEVRQYMFEIMDDPAKLEQEAHNYFKRKSPSSSLFVKATQIPQSPSKKIKID